MNIIVTMIIIITALPGCCVSNAHRFRSGAEPPVQEALLLLPAPSNAGNLTAVGHQLQGWLITKKRMGELVVGVTRSSSWLGH